MRESYLMRFDSCTSLIVKKTKNKKQKPENTAVEK